ncbi:unnamed protein product, partial [Polarella glacialis]
MVPRPFGEQVASCPQPPSLSQDEDSDRELQLATAACFLQSFCRRQMMRSLLRSRARAVRGEALARVSSGKHRKDTPSDEHLMDKSQSTVRWSRATGLAKIFGSGLNSGGIIRPLRRKEAKLMDAKYWIEAADPKHRYASKLVPYYKAWLSSGTPHGFFRWLDEGDGKDLDLASEGHPRKKLRTSSVMYLTEEQRIAYQVDIREGLLYWRGTGKL